ncbi:unnamed protein product [Ectocarpus sp. 13 AM-2016]
MRRKHWTHGIYPRALLDTTGTLQVTSASLHGKRTVGVLFSARWCRGLGSKLALFYHACLQRDQDAFEARERFCFQDERSITPLSRASVVFVSNDRDARAFRAYREGMPWLAVPYGETTATARLAGACKVRGTPSLAVFDGATGELLTALGAADVSDPGALADPLAVIGRWCVLGEDEREDSRSPSAEGEAREKARPRSRASSSEVLLSSRAPAAWVLATVFIGAAAACGIAMTVTLYKPAPARTMELRRIPPRGPACIKR